MKGKAEKRSHNNERVKKGDIPRTFSLTFDPVPQDYYAGTENMVGDVARILFYMVVRYEDNELVLEHVDSITVKRSNDPEHDKLSTLLEWYNGESVDNYERYRNHIINNKYQHNRDPFNDHPEFVSRIS